MNVLSYADDTTLYKSLDCPISLNRLCTIELDKILSWLNENKLVLNISKTTFMLFGTKNQAANANTFAMKINNTNIEQSGKGTTKSSVKFLGINLDETLSWNNHVSFVGNTISRGVFA